jgi:hypothetical protein
MSRSFTSNSKHFSWRRIIIDVAAVFLILLALEAIVRIPPINQYLGEKLDTYENLLWYDGFPPRYINDLKQQPDYTLWFLGSSYMITSIEPLEVQEQVSLTLDRPITGQNFGLSNMTNLKVLADFYERVLLPVDQPEYIVLFTAEGNFSNPVLAHALTSTYEQAFVYPDSISDYAADWMYRNSQLYHYLILARNTSIVSYAQTLREPRERGGYTERNNIFGCQFDEFINYTEAKMVYGRENLLYFIEMTKRNNIPLLIINLPLPYCTIQTRYADFEAYKQLYLVPTQELVEAQDIPFYELDTRFNETIEVQEQQLYFHDDTHSNIAGSALFSQWAAEIIAGWLKTMPEASQDN